MKISKKRLKKIINEEYTKLLNEMEMPDGSSHLGRTIGLQPQIKFSNHQMKHIHAGIQRARQDISLGHIDQSQSKIVQELGPDYWVHGFTADFPSQEQLFAIGYDEELMRYKARP